MGTNARRNPCRLALTGLRGYAIRWPYGRKDILVMTTLADRVPLLELMTVLLRWQQWLRVVFFQTQLLWAWKPKRGVLFNLKSSDTCFFCVVQ